MSDCISGSLFDKSFCIINAHYGVPSWFNHYLAEVQGLPDLPDRMSCVRWGESSTRSPAQASVGLFIQTPLQWGSLIHRPWLRSALCFGCLLFLSWAVVLSFLRTLFTMKGSPPMRGHGDVWQPHGLLSCHATWWSLLHFLRFSFQALQICIKDSRPISCNKWNYIKTFANDFSKLHFWNEEHIVSV